MTRRAVDAERTVSVAVSRAAGGRPIPGNDVSLLIDGGEAYPAMLDVIARAERWIHFENYIIRDDSAGRRFADALVARAEAGVAVRVLFDHLGCLSTPRRFWKALRAAGVEVRGFNPPRLLDLVANVSRNHRKLVVADGARGVLGGLCIGAEWTGEEAADGQAWRDTAVSIDGPAAAALDAAFAETWRRAGGTIPADHAAGAVDARGAAAVRVVGGVPGRERAFRVTELLAAGAIERLWITDAYLVAPPRLIQALRDAASDGVDVRLLVPGSSDIPLVRNLTRIGYRDLLRGGVRIWEWDGPMLHAKSIVSDTRWVRIGSSNLNPSSLFGNYELDVLIEDAALADAMEQQFRRDVARSREISPRALRGPRRISDVLPTVLTAAEPAAPVPHRRSRRERQQRAALALRTVAAKARQSLYGPATLVLLALAFMFLVLPKVTSLVFGVLCTWLAIAAAKEAFRRRAAQRR